MHEDPEPGPSGTPLLEKPRVTVVVDKSPDRWQPCRWGVRDDAGGRPLFRLTYERQQSTSSARDRRRRASSLKGPLRAARLCLLSILLPGTLIAVPLYLRYHVYGETVYPVGMSDMRLVDSRVSTTWCQRQVVRANTTFNAFLLSDSPGVRRERQRVSMSREMVLEDDMKEYWAFYLIRGSSVTVSTCCRWPGASLIVLRGHKNLHECAYIGDDSSEELEELQEIQGYGLVNATEGSEDDDSGKPHMVRRVRPGVIVHDERKPLQEEEIVDGELEEEMDTVLAQYLRGMGKLKSRPKAAPPRRTATTSAPPKLVAKPPAAAAAAAAATEDLSLKNADSSSSSASTSNEIFEEVLKKIQKLGARGRRVLRRLNEQLKATADQGSEVGKERDAIRQKIEGLLNAGEDEEKPRKRTRNRKRPRHQAEAGSKVESPDQGVRARRQAYAVPAGFEGNLFMHDEDANAAIEEGLTPDGIADHHVTLNETTLNDRSHSEFWSSFSSSEERLLNCSGLIINLPLTPHRECQRGNPDFQRASHPNTVTYRVPMNGYYFFIFNSENEIQDNFVHVKFNLEKVMYNVSNPLASCKNASGECSLPLDFFSREKVVLELPVTNNDSLWNEEFVVVTTCEPRTAIYLACVISVPLFIILFAFQ